MPLVLRATRKEILACNVVNSVLTTKMDDYLICA